MRWVRDALVASFVLAAGPALAQATDSAPETQPAPSDTAAPSTSIRIPAGTVVEVELTEALSSVTSQREQMFGLRLAEPIAVDGRVVVPAGANGGGEVIDAHASAFGGREGRLIISGRYLEIAGQRTRIRGMQITAAGARGTAERIMMIPYANVAAIFIHGGEVEIPAGARGMARLAVDVDVPLDLAAPADAASGAESPLTSAVAPEPSTSGENQQ